MEIFRIVDFYVIYETTKIFDGKAKCVFTTKDKWYWKKRSRPEALLQKLSSVRLKKEFPEKSFRKESFEST